MAGTAIGPYRLTQPIGHGGMGSVYEATHLQIGRRVAIKVLRAEHARDKESVARLFNEARAVSRIEHPGLVQIYDCDQLSDGRAYLVMEFLHGETLTQRLKRNGGRLPFLDALRIGYQLASILEATHAGGIIHRDIKPSNVSPVGSTAC
jgi:serine/threonine-protein kinase